MGGAVLAGPPTLQQQRGGAGPAGRVGVGVEEAQAHFHMGEGWGRLGREDRRAQDG